MWKTYHYTAIGRSHLEAAKGCQDYSDRYEDQDRKIVTACDGHGGAIYVRSDRGSRFASEAAIAVLKSLDEKTLNETPREELEKRLRLEVLCEWNARVERDLAQEPLREEETVGLDEEQRFRLRMQPDKAYGTTLHAAMTVGNKAVCVGIGDGGVFLLCGKRLLQLGEESEEDPVANITYSLCQEDAYKHIVAGVLDNADIDCLLACTDGTINPYRNYDNFLRSFVLPITEKLADGKEEEISAFMERLGREIGIGDDVSVAVLQRVKQEEREMHLPAEEPAVPSDELQREDAL